MRMRYARGRLGAGLIISAAIHYVSRCKLDVKQEFQSELTIKLGNRDLIEERSHGFTFIDLIAGEFNICTCDGVGESCCLSLQLLSGRGLHITLSTRCDRIQDMITTVGMELHK